MCALGRVARLPRAQRIQHLLERRALLRHRRREGREGSRATTRCRLSNAAFLVLAPRRRGRGALRVHLHLLNLAADAVRVRKQAQVLQLPLHSLRRASLLQGRQLTCEQVLVHGVPPLCQPVAALGQTHARLKQAMRFSARRDHLRVHRPHLFTQRLQLNSIA